MAGDMNPKLLPCTCGRRCRKRMVRVGVFKFKEIRCSHCGQRTNGDYMWLSDDKLLYEEWNRLNAAAKGANDER